MELNLEYQGITLNISADFPLNLSSLQAFLDTMLDVEVEEEEEEEDELFGEWDEEEEYDE